MTAIRDQEDRYRQESLKTEKEGGEMIPRECKRLAEVDVPIAEVSKYLALTKCSTRPLFRWRSIGAGELDRKR